MTDEKSNKALLDRYELLKGAEQHKNALIEVSRALDFTPRPPSFCPHQEKSCHVQGLQGIINPWSQTSLLTSGVTLGASAPA